MDTSLHSSAPQSPAPQASAAIEFDDVVAGYGDFMILNNLSFKARRGAITLLLGPNGAGKSTTMRMIVGLDRPTSGIATVGGREYRKLRAPLTEVGVLLDAKAVHTGRTARNHLRAMAATHGIPASRVDEVIDLAGIGPCLLYTSDAADE